MMRVLLVFIFVFSAIFTYGQELRANVTLNIPKLQLTDPNELKSLEGDINNFLNSQAFTDEDYEDYQKIKCTFTINITEEVGNGSFKGNILIQSTRPVYESSYETVLLSYIDNDFAFYYEPSMAIRYVPDGFENSMSAVLSYWAMVIIALDKESYAPMGGEDYLLAAQNIINAARGAQSSGSKDGWDPNNNGRNRYWLIENMLNPKCSDFRTGIYTYHRKGLDVLTTDAGIGQENIAKSLEAVSTLRSTYPEAMVMQLFSDAKTDEVVEVLSTAASQIKSQAYAKMVKISPGKRANLEGLRR